MLYLCLTSCPARSAVCWIAALCSVICRGLRITAAATEWSLLPFQSRDALHTHSVEFRGLCFCRVAIPAHIGRGRGYPGQVTCSGLTCRDKHPFTLTFTPTGNLASSIKLHVFGLWEEATQTWKNMQSPHGKVLPQPGIEPMTHETNKVY